MLLNHLVSAGLPMRLHLESHKTDIKQAFTSVSLNCIQLACHRMLSAHPDAARPCPLPKTLKKDAEHLLLFGQTGSVCLSPAATGFKLTQYGGAEHLSLIHKEARQFTHPERWSQLKEVVTHIVHSFKMQNMAMSDLFTLLYHDTKGLMQVRKDLNYGASLDIAGALSELTLMDEPIGLVHWCHSHIRHVSFILSGEKHHARCLLDTLSGRMTFIDDPGKDRQAIRKLLIWAYLKNKLFLNEDSGSIHCHQAVNPDTLPPLLNGRQPRPGRVTNQTELPPQHLAALNTFSDLTGIEEGSPGVESFERHPLNEEGGLEVRIGINLPNCKAPLTMTRPENLLPIPWSFMPGLSQAWLSIDTENQCLVSARVSHMKDILLQGHLSLSVTISPLQRGRHSRQIEAGIKSLSAAALHERRQLLTPEGGMNQVPEFSAIDHPELLLGCLDTLRQRLKSAPPPDVMAGKLDTGGPTKIAWTIYNDTLLMNLTTETIAGYRKCYVHLSLPENVQRELSDSQGGQLQSIADCLLIRHMLTGQRFGLIESDVQGNW